MEKKYITPSQRNVAVAACLSAIGCAAPAAHAALDFNFQPVDPSKVYLIGGPGGTPAIDVACINKPGYNYRSDSCLRGSGVYADPDKTPFYMERIVDNNLGYYHILIGDSDSTFSQEYYISWAGGTNWYNDFQMTNSAGTFNGGDDAKPGLWGGAFYRPLDSTGGTTGNGDSNTGNASGNPVSVVFRQTVKDTYMNQEVLKATFAKKPKITQTIQDSEITSNFVIDMSALGYYGASALTTGGTITNTMLVTDSQSGMVVTDFDINTTSQNSYVSGGKYQYTNGSGNGGSMGTYTYAPGAGFDVHSVNWAAYLDKNDPANYDWDCTITGVTCSPNY